MLQAREVLRRAKHQPWKKFFQQDNKWYVEAIFEADAFVRALPRSVEAFFFMRPSDEQEWACEDALSGKKCETYARAAWANMRRHFGLSARELPLVELDPRNYRAPFRAVLPAALATPES